MSKPLKQAIRLLSALELLPLEKCTSDAAEWRQEIADAIRDLQGTAMPPKDPLRYDVDGTLLSKERLDRRLQMIIDSWPSWAKMSDRERKNYGRKKVYQRNR
tara:strand:- start:65 stop:370 length:306 start_codon:yes stop_codon:yes gene_type:complete